MPTLRPSTSKTVRSKGTIAKEEILESALQVAGGQRSAATFVTLLPGVNTGNAPSSSATARFNGGQERSDEATLDGITMEEGLLSQSGMTAIQADFPISPEAVGEISVSHFQLRRPIRSLRCRCHRRQHQGRNQ